MKHYPTGFVVSGIVLAIIVVILLVGVILVVRNKETPSPSLTVPPTLTPTKAIDGDLDVEPTITTVPKIGNYCERDDDCGEIYCESEIICCVPSCINNKCTELCY